MSERRDELTSLRRQIATELSEPVRPAVAWLAEQIHLRHAGPWTESGHDSEDAVLGVLFYGSCLRKETDEGVLDFWVVVESYANAHPRRSHAWLNRVAPPNVYYLEREHEGQTLRTKYGVLDRKAFEQGTRLSAWHPYIWARFAQPARLLASRDDEAGDFFARTIAEACVTMVGRLVCFLPAKGSLLRFSLAAFWREAFHRTYDSERRPEAEESIQDLYHADEARYDAVAALSIPILTERGHFSSSTPHPRSYEVEIPESRLRRQRLRWRLMRPYARTLGLLRLLKTAYTFGDWVPYVLWKLERHTGRRIEPTERQRKHPLIFGWPIILPLLFRRNLR